MGSEWDWGKLHFSFGVGNLRIIFDSVDPLLYSYLTGQKPKSSDPLIKFAPNYFNIAMNRSDKPEIQETELNLTLEKQQRTVSGKPNHQALVMIIPTALIDTGGEGNMWVIHELWEKIRNSLFDRDQWRREANNVNHSPCERKLNMAIVMKEQASSVSSSRGLKESWEYELQGQFSIRA